MYKTITVSCVLTVALVIFAAVTSGGTPLMLFEGRLLAGILLFAVPVLAAAGALHDFGRAFVIGAHKNDSVSFAALRNSLEAVKLAVKTELFLGFLLAAAAFVVMMYNWSNLEFSGQNAFVLLAAPLYALVFALCLFPVETALKLRIIAYMGEDESELNPGMDDLSARQKRQGGLTVGAYLKVFLFFGSVVLFLIFGISSLRNEEKIPLPVDFSSFAGLVLFVCAAFAASGSFAGLAAALFRPDGKGAVRTNGLCETLDLAVKTLITGGGVMTLISFIAVLGNLADKTYFIPNMYVALLPASYGFVLALILLPVRVRLQKRRQEE